MAFALVGALALNLAPGPLHALEWSPLTGHRQAPIAPPGNESPGFTTLPPAATGITFTNALDEERSLTNQILLNGSGVALGDVDGDGRADIYLAALDRPNALYRNLGNWRFQDITTASGAACADQASTGVALVDIDGDRDLDLLVNGFARGTRLFLNDGRGRFSEATEAWGLRSTSGATSFAVADVDGDGALDLYVVNYRNDTLRDLPGIQFTVGATNGIRQILTINGQSAADPKWMGRFSLEPGGGILENGEPDAFHRNTGQGRFVLQPWGVSPVFLDDREQPVPAPYDWGLSAIFRDLNGDGAPDLYVCNDFQSPDRVWIHAGSGRFLPILGNSIRQTSLFSMGVDVADIDRDGLDDIFVADMLSPDHRLRQVQVMDATAFSQIRDITSRRPQSSRNTLFLNRGDGGYSEIAQMAGIDASDWSWCPAFLDVDLDGFEDLLVTTGHWRDAQHADVARELNAETTSRRLPALEQLRLRRRFPRLDTPNAAFRNLGDRTFAEAGSTWGFDSRRISQGMALADLDDDGDLDVVVNCLNDGPLVLRNNSAAPRIRVRLRGKAPNTQGVGARLRVRAPGLPDQTQEIVLGGRYLSSDDTTRSFAAGQASHRLEIEVRWRDGSRSIVTNAPANHGFEIAQETAQVSPTPPEHERKTEALREPAFDDISHLLGHEHSAVDVDDFAMQPLLPHRLSHAGPGVAWFDFNGDGWEDLILGAGQGARMAVFRNNAQGGFIPQRARILEATADHDQLGVLGARTTGDLTLLLSRDGSTAGSNPTPPLQRISLVSGVTDTGLLTSPGSAGPLALADVDGDGDLDLFVGGSPLPGRYPEATPSFLLRAENNPDPNPNPNRLGNPVPIVPSGSTPLGIVHGAVFTDLDSDGAPELVVAGPWSPLRILRFHPAPLSELDPALRWADAGSTGKRKRPERLSELTGWWNSVAAGDFDGDGRMDLIAGNWGRNTAQERYLDQPLRLRWGESGEGAPHRLLETQVDPRSGLEIPVRNRTAMAQGYPGIPSRFPTFAGWAVAPMEQILEATGPLPNVLTAAILDSVVLLQRDDGAFEVHPLPWQAQTAPVFGIAVGDLDGDGREDAFLAQNFFGLPTGESRLDAGTGVWLRGDGRGGFQPVSPSEAGIRVLGEGRAAALADFDHDGRVDLVVTQNRGLTQLFRNTGARPGLRVRLKGTSNNPSAIGAVLRLEESDGRLGPAREIRAGSGYLSQDAPTQVLGSPGGIGTEPKQPVALHIRWPGGRAERVPIPPGTQFVEPEAPRR
ncbi:MAG: FG-GAP-like repeat-containing protein [Limisphaerales bacterium]